MNDKDGNLDNHNGDQSIYVINEDGTGLRQVTHPSSVDGPSWSPDGKRIAFACDDGSGSQICVINADGSNLAHLTAAGSNSAPAWSPDGKQIAFMKDEGILSIYVMNIDGSQPKWLGATHGKTARLAWSPGGKHIAFQDERDGVARISVISVGFSGLTTAVEVTSGGDGHPAWSPDGTQLSYLKYTESAQVYVSNSDGTGEQAVTSGSGSHGWPSWAPDGKSIAFEGNLTGTLQVYLIGVDGHGQRLLTKLSGANFAPAWTGPSPAIDACLVGTWRSDILRSTYYAGNQPFLITGGAGVMLTFSSDGFAVRDYRDSTPQTGSLNGHRVVDVRRGIITFRITTSGGTMTFVDRDAGAFTANITYDGQQSHDNLGLAPNGHWSYTCSGAHLSYNNDDFTRVH